MINSSIQYPKGDLNPHSRNGQRILSPSCLPFHHSGSLGAKNGTRTRDPNLGKVVLYQLSYFRKCDCKDKMLFWFCKITTRKSVPVGHYPCGEVTRPHKPSPGALYRVCRLAEDELPAGGTVGSYLVALQEVATVFGGAGHGAAGRDVVGRAALGATQAEVVFVELDAYVGIDFDRAAEVVDEGDGVLVGHEHESSVAGSRGEVVGKSGGEFLAEDKAAVYETAAYAILVPHGLAGKLDPHGCGGYAVAVASVAGNGGQGEQEQE